MSNWLYKHHGFLEPPWETYTYQEIVEAPPDIRTIMRRFNREQQEAEKKNKSNYSSYLFHEKRRREAEQAWINRSQREEEKRQQKEEALEEEIEKLRAELDELNESILNESIKKRKDEEAYYKHPTWYLFENTAKGELISIALTRAEKSEFLKLIPTLKKIGAGGRSDPPHQWPGYVNVKKIRTPHDD